MRLRSIAREFSFRAFSALEPLGVHVLPRHYYTPIADQLWLRENKRLWTGRLELRGIPWDLDAQLRWVRQVSEPYYHEVRGLDFYDTAVTREWGPGFGPIESQVLHCVIRSFAPRKIIEIGSGVSTACILNASDMNARERRGSLEMICVEPFPRPAFSRLIGRRDVRHIAEPCQAVPQSVFEDLAWGDILFIDSSHSVKTGSDVLKIYLDVLPRLQPGVLIHIHDIYLPYAYPRDALTSYFGWQETSLLTALLTENEKFSTCACLSGLHYDRPGGLQETLTDYRPQSDSAGLQASVEGHFPSSFWLVSQPKHQDFSNIS